MTLHYVVVARRGTPEEHAKGNWLRGHIDIVVDNNVVVRLSDFSVRYTQKSGGRWYLGAPSRTVEVTNTQSGAKEKKWFDHWTVMPNASRDERDRFQQWVIQQCMTQIPDYQTPSATFAAQNPQASYGPPGQAPMAAPPVPQQAPPQGPPMAAPPAPPMAHPAAPAAPGAPPMPSPGAAPFAPRMAPAAPMGAPPGPAPGAYSANMPQNPAFPLPPG